MTRSIKILTILISLTCSVHLIGQSDAFITTWKTDNPGTSDDFSITIPAHTGHAYNYDVDWNDDGIYDEFRLDGSVTHKFNKMGLQRIRIRGTFPRIYFNNGGDAEKIIEINQWGTTKWENLNSAFEGCKNLTELANDAPDLSIVASMSEMFRRATNFTGDLSNWDVSNVPWMVSTFQDAEAFNSDISFWDVSNCNSIRFMFERAIAFNQDISGWDVRLMSDFRNTFNGATSFDQDLGDWDISAATNMSNFFDNSGMRRINYDRTLIDWSELPNIQDDVTFGAEHRLYCNAISARNYLAGAKRWVFDGDIENCFGALFKVQYTITDTTRGINLVADNGFDYNFDIDWDDDGVFEVIGHTSGLIDHTYTSSGLKTVSIRGKFPKYRKNGNKQIFNILQWGEIEWLEMESMFNSSSLAQITASNIPDLSKVTSLARMFNNCENFNSNINFWIVSTITDMSSLFRNAENYNQPLDNWDVSNVTDMSSMFFGTGQFNQSLDDWDVSNVIDFGAMFGFSEAYDQPFPNWETTSAQDMGGMFSATEKFNQPINHFDLSKVTTIDQMFERAKEFNQPINSWNTSSLTNMGQAFKGAEKFNQPMDSLDVSNVTNFIQTFAQNKVFNQPINDWDMSSARSLFRMFKGAEAFNQPLDNWDVSSVTNMTEAFHSTLVFDQSLGDWNLESVTQLDSILSFSALSTASYDATIIGWNLNNLSTPKFDILADGLTYCQAEEARQHLINLGWTFNGDAFDPTGCPSMCTPTDNTYIGPIGGGWSFGVNWSLGTIPDTCSNVIIPDDKLVIISATDAASCHIITVDENAGLEIETGGTLTTKE